VDYESRRGTTATSTAPGHADYVEEHDRPARAQMDAAVLVGQRRRDGTDAPDARARACSHAPRSGVPKVVVFMNKVDSRRGRRASSTWWEMEVRELLNKSA
jgi:translation elongation factor EF-Tu-like GTPase